MSLVSSLHLFVLSWNGVLSLMRGTLPRDCDLGGEDAGAEASLAGPGCGGTDRWAGCPAVDLQVAGHA